MKKITIGFEQLENLGKLWRQTKGTDDYMKYTTQYDFNDNGRWIFCNSGSPIFASEKLFKTAFIKKVAGYYWIYIVNEAVSQSIVNEKERYLITQPIAEYLYNNIKDLPKELLEITL